MNWIMNTATTDALSCIAVTADRTEVFSWTEWTTVAPRWEALVQDWAASSFFLKTDWITTWIEVFGNRLRPSIVFFRTGGADIAACLLVRRTGWRGFVPVRQMYLNASGEDECDETFLEHNNVLCRKGREPEAVSALAAFLKRQRWDELVLDGCSPEDPIQKLLACFPAASQRRDTRPDYYVDLTAVRESGKSYESTLSHKTRYNIRQNLRAYGEKGELRVHFAANEPEAQAMLSRLAVLHKSRWESEGRPGVFASVYYTDFHRKLIARTYAQGSIDLVEISAGGETLGMLYNFVIDGRVLFYQCGFILPENKKFSPGQLSLFLVIREYLDRGLSEFGFMAGGSDYKRWLSTRGREATWIVIERAGWKNNLVRGLKSIRNGLNHVWNRRSI